MSRDDLQHIRDRLLQLADGSTNQRLPFNVKRKGPLSRQSSKAGPTSKLSVQDFVRMDPGYTPNIEHLVFPNARRRSPQQVAPAVPVSEPAVPETKTRSRLAEMFALSRHLQKSSIDRQDSKAKCHVNRSVDSALESSKLSSQGKQQSNIEDSRRWVYSVDAAVRQNCVSKGPARISPSTTETKPPISKGPNVSVLHLRSTSEPREKGPKASYTSSAAARSYFASSRSTTTSSIPSTGHHLTKHQSLGSSTSSSTAHKWTTSPSFHSGFEVNSPGIFTFNKSCNRELSPVRWCDRDVDGVYLGKSGWVQVQQRSLEDNRRASYSVNLAKSLQSNRTGVKLANYHFFSEPSKYAEYSRVPSVESRTESSVDTRAGSRVDTNADTSKESRNESRIASQRPAVLQLQISNLEPNFRSPTSVPEPASPPSVTPIISPPLAFQDKAKSPVKSRTFFGKTPFLPRSNAIVDSDNSPPMSPVRGGKWTTTAPNAPMLGIKPKSVIKTSPGIEKPPRAIKKVPQAKSLEDTTASRRMQFRHQYGSSSSSSSSMGFRSLDSCLNRTNNVMPKLVEHADSSIDLYADADEEDNNSSSANVNIINPHLLQAEFNRKLSPSGRTTKLTHHRNQLRRSPAGSDAKPSPASSSSSSNECLPRSPPSTQHPTVIRRPPANRQFQPINPPQEDTMSRVRRSRSLQLPERQPPTFERGSKLSPQHPDHQRVGLKSGPSAERPQYPQGTERPSYPTPTERTTDYSTAKSSSMERNEMLEEELLREAEVVTGFLYGNRSRAAAQALLMHRYNNNNISTEEKNKESNKPALNDELTVYYVGNNRNERRRVLVRGTTAPILHSSKPSFENTQESFGNKGPCSPETCAFWPHCVHRENISREQHFVMRSSQSYPSHQRSLDSATSNDSSRTPSTVVEKKSQEQFRRRSDMENRSRKPQSEFRRISPNRPPATGSSMRRNGSTEIPVIDRKSSPRAGNISSSSSGSDMWLNTQRISSVKGSRASTPVDSFLEAEQHILSRPGSAPMQDVPTQDFLSQQRSMSLPKSFLGSSSSGSALVVDSDVLRQQSEQSPWNRQGTDSLSSSPGFVRKIATPEVAHTAPVTPQHEYRSGRSPLDFVRKPKATSTPHLPESKRDTRNWKDECDYIPGDGMNPSSSENAVLHTISSVPNTESVLKKFQKTLSMHFSQRKCSKDCSEDNDSEPDRSPQHTGLSSFSGDRQFTSTADKEKYNKIHRNRADPLAWRTNKERKKLNKATRNAKCNSGDSGIQIEISGGFGGNGESSESQDTDGLPFDSCPTLSSKSSSRIRPHSDIVSQALFDRCKTDVKQRSRARRVRRTHSDLGGQRLLGWEQRQAACRLLRNMSSGHPVSSRKRILHGNKEDGSIVFRKHVHGTPPSRPALRRSLSQPIDIDKLSPMMRIKVATSHPDQTLVVSEEEHEARRMSMAYNTSDEDTLSDSDMSSTTSLSRYKKKLELPETEESIVILAEAVFDHVAMEADELPFRAGDVIEVEDTSNREWWWGSNNSKAGWFPAQFVRLRVSQEDTVEDCLAAIASGLPVSKKTRRKTSISLLSNDQVRTSVVRELVHTERDFVKVLQDISEGYISECKKRKDMFSEEQISTIFINLEEIFHFQFGFLKDLESCINWETPHKSCIGECFLKHSDGFKMYSEYCNSHPLATAALQDLYQYDRYTKFFEACRLMRGLIEIPLDGYLLTPVQRICKYPLQLAELLKYTRMDHEDYSKIKKALEVMREVAMLINERKRRMESLEKLAAWQQRVDGWEGEDLIEMSSQLIRQGDVVRVTTGMWSNNVTLFLFDHQVVYCKKDILKKNSYAYKGRICLDNSEVIDAPDGKDIDLNVGVRHAIKIFDGAKLKVFIFCCRSAKEKQRWLEAFEEERRLVVQERNGGLDLLPSAQNLAKIAACRQKRPPRKLRHGNLNQHLGSSMQQLSVGTSNTNSLFGRKMATWFNFGAGKKSQSQDIRTAIP